MTWVGVLVTETVLSELATGMGSQVPAWQRETGVPGSPSSQRAPSEAVVLLHWAV